MCAILMLTSLRWALGPVQGCLGRGGNVPFGDGAQPRLLERAEQDQQ
eukprot:COSAG06_NODE_28580_length_571_cov_39.033898_1_plen_46_part_10